MVAILSTARLIIDKADMRPGRLDEVDVVLQARTTFSGVRLRIAATPTATFLFSSVGFMLPTRAQMLFFYARHGCGAV